MQREWVRRSCWRLWFVLPICMAGSLAVSPARAFGAESNSSWAGGSAEDQETFLEKKVDKMLDWVNATDTQRAAIKTIVERMRTDLQPIRQEKTSLRTQLKEAFAAQSLDPIVIENLRTQAVGLFDRASSVVSKAAVDCGNVLTAEQRQTLMKRVEEHRQQKRNGHK